MSLITLIEFEFAMTMRMIFCFQYVTHVFQCGSFTDLSNCSYKKHGGKKNQDERYNIVILPGKAFNLLLEPLQSTRHWRSTYVNRDSAPCFLTQQQSDVYCCV